MDTHFMWMGLGTRRARARRRALVRVRSPNSECGLRPGIRSLAQRTADLRTVPDAQNDRTRGLHAKSRMARATLSLTLDESSSRRCVRRQSDRPYDASWALPSINAVPTYRFHQSVG